MMKMMMKKKKTWKVQKCVEPIRMNRQNMCVGPHDWVGLYTVSDYIQCVRLYAFCQVICIV